MKNCCFYIIVFIVLHLGICDAEERVYLQKPKGLACIQVNKTHKDWLESDLNKWESSTVSLNEKYAQDNYLSNTQNTEGINFKTDIIVDLELFDNKLLRTHFGGHAILNSELLQLHGYHQLRYDYYVYNDEPSLSVWLDGILYNFTLSSDPYITHKETFLKNFEFEQIVLRNGNNNITIIEGECPDLDELSTKQIILISVAVVGSLIGIIFVVSCCVILCPILCRKIRNRCCSESHDEEQFGYNAMNSVKSDPRNSMFVMESNEELKLEEVDQFKKVVPTYPGMRKQKILQNDDTESSTTIDSNNYVILTANNTNINSDYNDRNPGYYKSSSTENRDLLSNPKTVGHYPSLSNLDPVDHLFNDLK